MTSNDHRDHQRQRATIQVLQFWGQTLIAVREVSPPCKLFVGGEDAHGRPADFPLDPQQLGRERQLLLSADSLEDIRLAAPEHSSGCVELADGRELSLDEARATQEASAIVGGRPALRLTWGTSVSLSFGSISFRITLARPEARQPRRSPSRRMRLLVGACALSLGAHVGLGCASAAFDGPSSDPDGMTDERRALIQHYLTVAAEKEEELAEKELEQVEADQATNREGGTGARAKGQEGAMGAPSSPATGSRYGVAGPDPQQALRDAHEFGMIGMLNSGAGGDPDAPPAPWGRDDSLGHDPTSAKGSMWGDSIGNGYGASGIGEGGGGRGAPAIGLGQMGTIGHGAGVGTGQGYGSGHGRAGVSRQAKSNAAAPLSLAPIDPNGRFSTTYRPGAGHLSAFEAAVASGNVPASARELVADVGGRYAPTIPLSPDRALSHVVDLERSALPPSGGATHLRIALRSSPQSASGSRPPLAVSLVLDTSGSMGGEPIEKARAAAATLVRQLSPSDSFALITFSTSAELAVPPGPIAGRQKAILSAIANTFAGGGTNIDAGLGQAYTVAQNQAQRRGLVPVVLLLSDGQATSGNTDRGYLAGKALQAFQDGVQTSTFGLGQQYDEALMSSIASDGAGGYYYLRDVEQIFPAFRAELAQRLDPAATAVELRVRLDDDVSLLHVYGSQRLGELDAARERAKEVAADQQAAQRYGIKRDRQQDNHGGMRFFIPAFARDDAHSLLLQVALPPGVTQRTVGTIELKYKDRIFERNVVEEIPIRIGFAKSDAASAGTINPSVTRTVQGYRAGEDMLRASRLIADGNTTAALDILGERAGLLRKLAAISDESSFEREASRMARLAMLAQGPSEPRAMALVFETAARARLR